MSANPLLSRPDDCVIMPMKLFPSVEYFTRLAPYGTVIIDDTARYDKRQKDVHRYDIADVTGRLSLTVPVGKPQGHFPGLTWEYIPLSRHGNWWHVHQVTLESAYGRTPFFEFYIDRLARFCAPSTPDDFASVADLCREAFAATAAILGLENRILFRSRLSDGEFHDLASLADDLRFIPGNTPSGSSTSNNGRPFSQYWQVRAARHGFIPSLSILDLIFNLGPEAPLHLLT